MEVIKVVEKIVEVEKIEKQQETSSKQPQQPKEIDVSYEEIVFTEEEKENMELMKTLSQRK